MGARKFGWQPWARRVRLPLHMSCLGDEVDDVDVDFDVDCDVQMRWCPGGKGNQTAGSVFLRRPLGGLTETPIGSV